MTVGAHHIGRVDDLAEGTAMRVAIDGLPIAVVKDASGTLHAVGDTCSHADISLSEGEVEGSTLECWAHGSRFDLRTGEPLSLPAYEAIPVYELSICDDEVYVDTARVLNAERLNS